jgi:DNA-binding beta-propeller fold protein YncE
MVLVWGLTAPAAFAGIVLAGGLFSGRVDRWDTATNTLTTFSDIFGQTGSAPGIVGMAYNPVTNRVLVAGRFTGTIYELNSTTGAVVGQHTSSGLNQPAGLAVDASGNVYVANNGGNTLTRFNSSFTSETTIVLPNLGVGDNLPSGVAVNSSGKVIISTFAGAGVLVYDPSTGVTSSFNATNPVANGLATVDSSDAVYVGGAAFSNSVTKFDASGAIVGGVTIDSSLLPPPPQSFTSPDFTSPSGVSIDGSGNLLVAALGRTNPFSPGDNFQNNGGLFLFDSTGALMTSRVQTTPYTSVMYFSAVPEPSSMLAAACGLAGASLLRWRRKVKG